MYLYKEIIEQLWTNTAVFFAENIYFQTIYLLKKSNADQKI